MILVVDDEAEIGNLIVEYFKGEGVDSMATTFPEKALQIVDQFQVSCVVTDIAMPKINGIELLKILKEHHPKLKVICVSAFAQMMISDLEEAHIDCFLQKPFLPKDLLNCVNGVMRPKAF